MSRINIEIDDELIARVMDRYGIATKREAVDYALRSLYVEPVEPLDPEELLVLEGTGWEGDRRRFVSGRPART
jgi:Arc/MetJ family transcription regulator